MPRNASLDVHTLRILQDTEVEGETGFVYSDFARICEDNTEVYGRRGSATRRKYQYKKNNLLKYSSKALEAIFEASGTYIFPFFC